MNKIFLTSVLPAALWRIIPLRCARLAFALLMVNVTLGAQITGTVRAAGVPLSGAAVELWAGDRTLATRATTQKGSFAFAERPDGAVALLVRAIGFSPRRLALSTVKGALIIDLERLPVMLAPVTAEESPPICPNREDPAARSHWLRAVARYKPFLADTLGLLSETTGQLGIVMREELNSLDSSKFWKGSRWHNGVAMMGVRSRVITRGFASQRPPGNYAGGELGLWYYPELDADIAGIFSDSAFASQHTLSLLPMSDSVEAAIVFCPRDRRRPALAGTLIVDPSSGFIRATWLFTNPQKGAEHAGGDVVFVPASDSQGSIRLPLLSASGTFWRKLPSGAYYRRWQAYTKWELFAGPEPPKSRIP